MIYHITATRNGQTKFYNAFDLMNKPNTLLTTQYQDCAFVFRSIEKAQEQKAWLEGKFPEYSYSIIEG